MTAPSGAKAFGRQLFFWLAISLFASTPISLAGAPAGAPQPIFNITINAPPFLTNIEQFCVLDPEVPLVFNKQNLVFGDNRVSTTICTDDTDGATRLVGQELINFTSSSYVPSCMPVLNAANLFFVENLPIALDDVPRPDLDKATMALSFRFNNRRRRPRISAGFQFSRRFQQQSHDLSSGVSLPRR